ncbi:glycosylphosphatidylinositol anchored molecule like [Phyllostomus discolor]|uniref:Glycosylphosphatidylinositol anchored molecule like n=1 Tax=Phyllostomus discolor TaxID=89673 RepID=A0A833ZUP7_9CHIR|nr:glycosylphosphatidylinositol anchored molecule like [Phyllostomus discolor]
MLLLGALLLATVLTLADPNTSATAGDSELSVRWTYNVQCFSCAVINTFQCSNTRVCPYETRRCMTLAIRVNARELLVYKNCTDNCSFVYAAMQPGPAPKANMKRNSFYWALCCGSMTCNSGGPANVERDVGEPQTIEEAVQGAERLRGTGPLLTAASLLLSGALARPLPSPEHFLPP